VTAWFLFFVVVGLGAFIVLCDFAIVVRSRLNHHKTRRDFYCQYIPPKGQKAVLDRKQIEQKILGEEENLNRRQRRALAHDVQRTMKRRAIVAQARS
jgi:hypothetical protein